MSDRIIRPQRRYRERAPGSELIWFSGEGLDVGFAEPFLDCLEAILVRILWEPVFPGLKKPTLDVSTVLASYATYPIRAAIGVYMQTDMAAVGQKIVIGAGTWR
jgi:hypothetical protein